MGSKPIASTSFNGCIVYVWFRTPPFQGGKLSSTLSAAASFKRKKMENIKAGWALYITTWENDYDHVTSVLWSGYSEADKNFLSDFLKYFRSKGSNYNCFGNATWGSQERKRFSSVFEELQLLHVQSSFSTKNFSDIVSDYIGWSENGDYIRCIESVEVQYFEEPVVFNFTQVI